MKKFLLSLSLLLVTLAAEASGIGYVDYSVIYRDLPASKQIKTKIDSKVQEIKAYNKTTREMIQAQKTQETKLQVSRSRKINQTKLEREYINLRYQQENVVKAKVKTASDIVLKQKQLDIIIDKKSAISGGVDCTYDVLKAIQ